MPYYRDLVEVADVRMKPWNRSYRQVSNALIFYQSGFIKHAVSAMEVGTQRNTFGVVV